MQYCVVKYCDWHHTHGYSVGNVINQRFCLTLPHSALQHSTRQHSTESSLASTMCYRLMLSSAWLKPKSPFAANLVIKLEAGMPATQGVGSNHTLQHALHNMLPCMLNKLMNHCYAVCPTKACKLQNCNPPALMSLSRKQPCMSDSCI